MTVATARAAATKVYIDHITRFEGKTSYVEYVEQRLKALTDAEFRAMIERMREGTAFVRFEKPNLEKPRMSVKKLMKIAKDIGVELFQKVIMTDQKTGEIHITNEEYLVCHLPWRRQQQHLLKKAAIAKHHRSIDERTGQVTGKDSKASSLSFPELQVLYSHNLTEAIREFGKFRGGDIEGHRRLMRTAMTTGDISMDAVDDGTTRAESSVTLNTYFNAAHHGSNL